MRILTGTGNITGYPVSCGEVLFLLAMPASLHPFPHNDTGMIHPFNIFASGTAPYVYQAEIFFYWKKEFYQ